ncbi:MAG: hypothetical protein GX771_09195 [Halomonadaceae bacterium]|nr:hypothetical protein [Halomonadaceae bacterium]
MHIFKTEAEKAREERNKALKDTTIFLGTIASLLRTRNFARWYASNESRFPWAGEPLAKRLRHDLMYQVNQCLDRDYRRLTEIDRLREIARLCEELVEPLEEKGLVKNTKKEKTFRFPRDVDPSQMIFEFLSRRDTVGMIKDLPGSFYVWNVISSLIIYARARDTLVNPTGNVQLERLLTEMGEEYLLSGYPHDLLSHDAHAIRSSVPVKALIVRNAYCSTFLVKEGEDIEHSPGMRVVQIKKSSKAA